MRVRWLRKSFPGTDGNSLGGLMQRLVYAADELVVSLTNSLRQREYELRRSKTLVGRFLALFDDRDASAIELDGTRLWQLRARPSPPIRTMGAGASALSPR